MQGITGLFLAILAGDNALVRSFIDGKADLEAKDVIQIDMRDQLCYANRNPEHSVVTCDLLCYSL